MKTNFIVEKIEYSKIGKNAKRGGNFEQPRATK